jgi:enoyl-CoA hydratase/carnithine racemase
VPGEGVDDGPLRSAELIHLEQSLTGDVRVVIVRVMGPALAGGIPPAGADASPPGSEAGARVDHVNSCASGVLPRPAQAGPPDGARVDFPRRADLLSVAVLTGAVPPPWMDLALLCDLRFAPSDARLRLGRPGRLPRLGASAALVRILGYSRALEVLLTGEEMNAERAYALGLLTWTGPPDGLDARVAAVAEAALAWPRDALAELKALLGGSVAAAAGPAEPGRPLGTALDRALAVARQAESDAEARLRDPD